MYFSLNHFLDCQLLSILHMNKGHLNAREWPLCLDLFRLLVFTENWTWQKELDLLSPPKPSEWRTSFLSIIHESYGVGINLGPRYLVWECGANNWSLNTDFLAHTSLPNRISLCFLLSIDSSWRWLNIYSFSSTSNAKHPQLWYLEVIWRRVCRGNQTSHSRRIHLVWNTLDKKLL